MPKAGAGIRGFGRGFGRGVERGFRYGAREPLGSGLRVTMPIRKEPGTELFRLQGGIESAATGGAHTVIDCDDVVSLAGVIQGGEPDLFVVNKGGALGMGWLCGEAD